MKHLLLVLLSAIFLLSSCNNNKSTAGETPGTAVMTAKDSSDAQKKTEALQQLVPYTTEQMKALLPIELEGDSAGSLSATTNMGTGFVRAVYPLSDSASVEISLFDCGGSAGAGIYNAQFINQLDNQSENESEYTRTIDFKGGNAIEHLNKKTSNAMLMYLTADRLLVILEGTNTGIDQLKKTAAALKLK